MLADADGRYRLSCFGLDFENEGAHIMGFDCFSFMYLLMQLHLFSFHV